MQPSRFGIRRCSGACRRRSRDRDLEQITDTSEISGTVDKIVADDPTQVEQLKCGNQKVMGWFVGQVMKATQGKANPGVVNQLLKEKLGL